jgi:hypothetical protein
MKSPFPLRQRDRKRPWLKAFSTKIKNKNKNKNKNNNNNKTIKKVFYHST